VNERRSGKEEVAKEYSLDEKESSVRLA